jgi:Fe-S oxidoreductase
VILNNADTIRSSYFFIPDCTTGKTDQIKWLSDFKNAQIQMPHMENTCCGAGFCLPALNPEEAEKMTEALILQAIESGSEYILTANEICLQQVRNIVSKNKHAIKSLHIIDLFASAL